MFYYGIEKEEIATGFALAMTRRVIWERFPPLIGDKMLAMTEEKTPHNDKIAPFVIASDQRERGNLVVDLRKVGIASSLHSSQ